MKSCSPSLSSSLLFLIPSNLMDIHLEMICGECADLDEQGEISTLPRCHDGMCAELLRQEEPTPGRHFSDKSPRLFHFSLFIIIRCVHNQKHQEDLFVTYVSVKTLSLFVHQNLLSLSSSVRTLSLFIFGLSLLFLLSSICFLLSLSDSSGRIASF